MKQIIILMLGLFYSISGKSQFIQLKKDIKLDTLFISFHQTDTNDVKLKSEIYLQFDSLIHNFNSQNNAFKVIKDSTQAVNSLSLTMGSINYVTYKRRLWTASLDLAMIGVNILILPFFPPLIPFYLMPATVSKISIETKTGILKQNSKMFVNPNGTFSNIEKQKIKFKQRFNKDINYLLKTLNKQYLKNNKFR